MSGNENYRHTTRNRIRWRPSGLSGTFFAIFFAAGLATATIPTLAAQNIPPGAVAVINGDVVSEDEFTVYLRTYLRSKLFHGGSQERIAELANEAMENLILDRLLLTEADRRAILADPNTVSSRLEALEKRYRDSDNWPSIEALLPKIRGELEEQARVEQLKSDVEKVAEPSEADILRYYRANPNLFTQPPAYDLDLILIGLPPTSLKNEWAAAQQQAEELHTSLLAGQSFAALARQHSTGATAQDGGALGRVHAGQLVPNAEELVSATAVGDITSPIRLLEGVAIFRVNEKVESAVSPFDTVRDRAAGLYRRARAQEQWSKLIADLRERADVTLADISSLAPRLMQSGEVE